MKHTPIFNLSWFCSILVLAVGISLTAARAQDRVVTGKVTSAEDGSGMPGVNIVLKGSQKGTSTNAAGTYSFEVSGNNPVLVFSFVGYKSRKYPLIAAASSMSPFHPAPKTSRKWS